MFSCVKYIQKHWKKQGIWNRKDNSISSFCYWIFSYLIAATCGFPHFFLLPLAPASKNYKKITNYVQTLAKNIYFAYQQQPQRFTQGMSWELCLSFQGMPWLHRGARWYWTCSLQKGNDSKTLEEEKIRFLNFFST